MTGLQLAVVMFCSLLGGLAGFCMGQLTMYIRMAKAYEEASLRLTEAMTALGTQASDVMRAINHHIITL